MAKKKLSNHEYAHAFFQVGKTAFQIAPGAGIIRLLDSMVQAGLPIATTALAALTTTALADAYTGDETASSRVLWLVIATSAVSIVMLSWNSVSSYVSQKTRYKIDAAIEDQMMTQFARLPFASYDDKNTADVHEKARRFSYVFSYIFDTIGLILTNAFGAVGAIAALAYVNIWLALAVLFAVIPGVVIQLRLARKQAQHWDVNITNRRRKSNLGWIMQNSHNMAEMRVYGVAKHLIKMYARLRDADEKERLQLELNTTWSRLVADILAAMVELAALLWIVLQIIDRAQPVGQFLYVQQMVGRAMSQAESLAGQIGRIDEDLANIVDYQQFVELAVEQTHDDTVSAVPERIAFNNVSFCYPKVDKEVIVNMSFEVQRGQHIAIVGENGAGKSTITKLLLGLYSPTKGSVTIDGTPLSSVDVASWHQYIALLSQNFVSYYFATIRENVLFGNVERNGSDEDFRRAYEDAQLDTVIDGLAHGDSTFIERWMAKDTDDTTATELSGGQYQRLAIARNFYRDAPIVVLDEPTSAIDAVAEEKIFERLFAQKEKTIVTVSHRLSTIKKADAIYVIQNGQLVEQGTYAQLSKPGSEFARMFQSQIE